MSEQPKHTPGPWKLHPCSNGGLLLRRGDQMGRNTHIQSSLQILPEADAHLIAAAPELLEAAKTVLAWFDALKQEQYERTVYGHTLESAAANWNTPSLVEGSLDLEPLMKAVAKAENR